ncbi:hypothetical protein HMP09_2112 [Sphingomonas sp. HMP9]|nr:hypothetical protein HMP09_2112 [Sphingomonas sp. HMP9]
MSRKATARTEPMLNGTAAGPIGTGFASTVDPKNTANPSAAIERRVIYGPMMIVGYCRNLGAPQNGVQRIRDCSAWLHKVLGPPSFSEKGLRDAMLAHANRLPNSVRFVTPPSHDVYAGRSDAKSGQRNGESV